MYIYFRLGSTGKIDYWNRIDLLSENAFYDVVVTYSLTRLANVGSDAHRSQPSAPFANKNSFANDFFSVSPIEKL